jgi:hypothetical protein
MVEIRFNKKRARIKLIYGLGILLIAFYFFYNDHAKNALGATYLILGLIFLIKFYVQTTKPYVIITEDSISKFSYFKRKIFFIKQITSIKHPDDDFVLKSGQKEMILSQNKIDKKSYVILKAELQKIQKQRGY